MAMQLLCIETTVRKHSDAYKDLDLDFENTFGAGGNCEDDALLSHVSPARAASSVYACQELKPVGVQKKQRSKAKALPKVIKKASFNRKGGRRKRKLAKAAKKAKEAIHEEATEPRRHGTYDLTAMRIPKDALPQGDKPNKGAHSYTVHSPGNECAVEVLLRNRAFYSKRLANDAPGPKGQVGWATFQGIEAAWYEVKKRVGWIDH